MDDLVTLDALANIALSKHLERELRSDHAGETGAVSIYKGIVAVSKWRNKPELVRFALEHGKTEAEHLKLIEQWLPADKRSRLLGPWRLAVWLTGAIAALFGGGRSTPPLLRSRPLLIIIISSKWITLSSLVRRQGYCPLFKNAKPMSVTIETKRVH